MKNIMYSLLRENLEIAAAYRKVCESTVKDNKSKKRICEGAGAGYDIEFEGLKIGNVTKIEPLEDGDYRFEAEILPCSCKVSANSYYDCYLHEEYLDIDGGKIYGEIGIWGNPEDYEDEINREIRGKMDVTVSYGAGYIHSFLPKDGKMTFDYVRTSKDSYLGLTKIEIDSKQVAEAINYGYEHCYDEDGVDMEIDDEETDVEAVEEE